MSAAAPLHALVDEQNALVREASLALPGQFTQCTYDLGYLKQAVYLCLTCAEPRGICSACSIACHGDHEQIELFPKRHFRCDCPTSALAHACTLKSPVQPLNADNIYGQNYTGGGLFCRCSTTYDAKLERETMVQCLACEEWFHESCLNLRERVPPRLPETETEAPAITEAPDDARSEATSVCSDTDIPPALVPGDSYDALICGPCVLTNPTVKRYAGTQGVRMVVPKTDGPGFTLIGKDAEEEAGLEVEVVRERHEAEDTAEIGTKRRAAGDGDEGSAPSKRPRPAQDGASTCLAPPINALAQSILLSSTDSGSRAYGDVFLSAGWRDRWCRCSSCDPPLLLHPYLLTPEETYEPPTDPDASLSLEELGMRALQSLPHERALDSIRAYNAMRDDLMLYLRPFAESGREVREEDITAFFAARRAENRQRV